MLLRKLIFALCEVSNFEPSVLKLFFNIMMQFNFVAFLISGRPYEGRFKNNLEIFNEICILLIMISFIPFTDNYSFDSDMRFALGFVTFGLAGLFLGANMVVILSMSLGSLFISIYRYCKKKCNSRPQQP